MFIRNLSRQNKIRLIAVTGVILLFSMIYLIGMFYYSSHFLPKTFINGVDVSNLNMAAANEKLKDINPYIDLVELKKDLNNTVTERFDLKNVGKDIVYDSSAILNAQDKVGWFASMNTEKDLICNKISGDFTKALIKPNIQGLYFMKEENTVRPSDATLAIENENVVLKDAIDGNYIAEKDAIDLIAASIKEYFNGNGSSELDLNEYYEKPSLREDDPVFASKTEDYQKVLDASVSISVTEDENISLSKSDLLKFDQNELAVDQDALTSYIHDLYMEHIDDHEGYIDRSKLQLDLSHALLSGEEQTVTVLWNDQRNTGRVDVTVPEQILRYYENDVLILESPVVTGNPELTEETPHGEFSIRKKDTDSYLMGRDYIEHVDYWMGFDETGRVYGLHDASWKEGFGGDVWLYDPSRGCVNMPVEKIAILFDYLDIGTEVSIHD